jgi:GT2 family glycosyltransferase
MAGTEVDTLRPTADGKFFRVGARKFFVKGLTYGPFAPNGAGEFFPEPEQASRDLQQILELGANLLRLYHVPPKWFLDLAAHHGLKLLVDIPWPSHLCFLDSPALRERARQTVRSAVTVCGGHPAVFGFSVANEISADLVRWSGTQAVEAFIDELVQVAKSVDPECLCTFASFPPTEFLRPRAIDFVTFNVYLHGHTEFSSYLARLQMLADNLPLLLGEFGMDSLREGEERKCALLAQHLETVFRHGLAGAVVFSYTDDWYRGGHQITDWAFGLTTRAREPKPSFHAVQRAFLAKALFPLPRTPRVSVVVASYNGVRTLRTCLESLTRLRYPDYEVILVDDGSTDETPEIAEQFPTVRTIRHENHGLSAARNTGIAASTGEIVAFTDSDCRADEDWLTYLVSDLLRGQFAGIGGPNLLPPEDSAVAAAVMVSPGGPAHVMLTDTEAEHIPGCNMAFFKWALEQIGGFDPVFRKAGDDVDVCWRLRQCGYRLGFSPAGFVWHYRRSTVQAYRKQQRGYGEAEALLRRKHPEFFNQAGQSMWQGRIYSPARFSVGLGSTVIYRGIFASGFFQRLYAPAPSYALTVFTSLEFHALVTTPLLLLSIAWPWLLPLPVAGALVSAAFCTLAAQQADLSPKQARWWSRPLVAWLFFLQPLDRGWAHYRSRLWFRPKMGPRARQDSDALQVASLPEQEVVGYWSSGAVDRLRLLSTLMAQLERERWQFRSDLGWSDHDLEVLEARWSRLRFTTTTEQLEEGRLNLRCRIQTSWSLRARVCFGLLMAAELALTLTLAPRQPWVWMVLLSLPILTWFFEYDQSQLRKAFRSLLQDVSAELGLARCRKQ